MNSPIPPPAPVLCKLQDLAEIFSGYTAVKQDEPSEDGLPLIRVGDIEDATASILPVAELSRIAVPEGKSLEHCQVRENDILMSSKGIVGKLAFVSRAHEGAVASSNFLVFRPHKDVNPYALLGILKSSPVQRHIQSRNRGVSLQMITIRDLKDLEVPVPGEQASNLLRELITSHVSLIASAQKAESARESLFGAMLDQVIWSEVQ